jgi:predicted amidophosphoribosyltransferase
MTTAAEPELKDYPAVHWSSDEGGRCARCSEPCKKYGSMANPLCRDCFAEVTRSWSGVRQKGFNA